MPLAVVVLGAAAAFATNAAKQSQSAQSMVRGYHYDSSQPPGQQCVERDVWCTTVVTQEICKDSFGNNLRISTNNGLSCPTLVFKP